MKSGRLLIDIKKVNAHHTTMSMMGVNAYK